MAALPALTDLTPIPDVHKHLNHIVKDHLKPQHLITLYEHPVGFKDGQMKANWAPDHEEYNSLGIHSDFFRHPLNGNLHKAALFITSTESWVGKPWPPTDGNWYTHAWVAVILGKPDGKKGKQLVIWDSNAERRLQGLGSSRKAVLYGPQKRLLEVTGGKNGPEKVWYGGSGNTSTGICLKLAVDWIKKIAENGLGLEAEGMIEI